MPNYTVQCKTRRALPCTLPLAEATYLLEPRLRLSAAHTDSIGCHQRTSETPSLLLAAPYFSRYTFPLTDAPFLFFPPGRSPPCPLVLSSKPFPMLCPLWPGVSNDFSALPLNWSSSKAGRVPRSLQHPQCLREGLTCGECRVNVWI